MWLDIENEDDLASEDSEEEVVTEPGCEIKQEEADRTETEDQPAEMVDVQVSKSIGEGSEEVEKLEMRMNGLEEEMTAVIEQFKTDVKESKAGLKDLESEVEELKTDLKHTKRQAGLR